MEQYISKDAIVAWIKSQIDSLERNSGCSGIFGETQMAVYDKFLSFLDTTEVKEVDLIIHTIIAECCDWLAMNTNLSHDKIEGCRNLMLTVKEEHFKAQEPTEDEHWQDVRERAAIAAMQGVMKFFGSIDYDKEEIAKLAVEQADAIIEQLKVTNK